MSGVVLDRRAVLLAGTALACMGLGSRPKAAEPGPPDEPRVLDDIATLGRRGGEVRTLIGRARDTRLLYVYGYARLVGYDQSLKLQPDLLRAVDNDGDRDFTLHLRKGHRWSDGEPFTSEDFRFYWEDVANNPMLMPTGPDVELLVDGEKPEVTFPDPLTVRYRWSKPNPYFLPALAAASPVFIYRPAHYLKQFHERYVDKDRLDKMVKDGGLRDWADLFGRADRINKIDNPDMPDVQPWILRTAPPSDRFIAERNPYYHRVDAQGQQLPYIDRLILEVVDSKLIPIKTGAGETDLQARGLFFKDYTFLKESEKRSGMTTLLWREARGAHLAIYPNLNAMDPVWRNLFRDVRFRRALSLGVDRDAISQYLYFGLATPANNTILPDSPLWSDAVGTAFTEHDPVHANALLDEIGLIERDAQGIRKLPDGRPLQLVVETAGEDTEQADVLELVAASWKDIGFKIATKPSQRDVLRNRIFSGEALMTIWYGLENGVVLPEMAPLEFAPTAQDQAQWPKWGQYFETKGEAGEAPDMPEAQALMALFDGWRTAPDLERRREIWQQMLQNHADNVWTIGLVAGVKQPVVIRNALRNVPSDAIYNWEPGAHFGIYRPDTWWLEA
jgi:peptide/nickel transport system substrate-binding protein